MLKITNKNNEVSYVLTEVERKYLASQAAVELVNERLKELEKFVGSDIDFFTKKTVKEDNKWFFNVSKDGVLYSCIYDNEHMPVDPIEKEAAYFLMWRYELSGGYTENIGNYIEGNKSYSVEETKYNDCNMWYFDKENNRCHENEVAEEVELNETNKEQIYNWFMSL